MIAALLATLTAGAIAQGETRYRFELGGEPVGTAELSVRCGGARCAVRWSVRTRAPEAAGGAIHARRVELESDLEGRWIEGPLTVYEDGEPVGAKGSWGAVPITLAELVLARARADESPCIEVFDERSGELGKACSRRASGANWEVDVRGERERVRLGANGLPAEVEVPGQRVGFFADPRAEVPASPPRLFGVTVPGEPGAAGARRFCGAPLDPLQGSERLQRVPAPSAGGATCREKTARWLELAARAGLAGRTAVGVAWDGAGFAWHSWAEVQVGAEWVAVDPSFGQLPARGPRFTLARFADGDAAARAAAGRRVLECWGRARIE
ncbi:MAG TPA: transglutaminase domain-containing protein [Anaeromyxobacteraceae bacterium]|nr:transglutaminase domain-containing protein [Anaeromyxobacteraceae bacterium]